MQQLVITAVGPDRPGLVDAVSQTLTDHKANIADSRMMNLRGEFAMILLAESPDEQVDSLNKALPEVGQTYGLTVMVRRATPDQANRRGHGVPYRISTYAMDQAGLVHRITHVLHQHKINIEELQTNLTHGPHTGTPLFSMDMVVTLPADVALSALRDELEQLCDDLNCDLDINPA